MPESPVSARKTPRPLSAFRRAEAMSHDLSQLPGKGPSYFDDVKLAGLLSKESIEEQIQWLRRLDVDSYIQRVVNPSENQKRLSSAEVIQQLGGSLIQEEIEGPLYHLERSSNWWNFVARSNCEISRCSYSSQWQIDASNCIET